MSTSKWFKNHAQRIGKSQARIAKDYLELDSASFSKTLNGGRRLQCDEAIVLAEIFRVPLTEVMKAFGYECGGLVAELESRPQVKASDFVKELAGRKFIEIDEVLYKLQEI